MQRLGSLSSNNSVFTYNVPNKTNLFNDDQSVSINNNSVDFTVTFSLLINEVS